MHAEATAPVGPPGIHWPRARRWILAGASIPPLVALSLLRQAGAPSWRTLWAEDGFVFLRGSLLEGFDAFTTTYAGYLHVLPRLLASPEALLPISWAAAYSSVAAAAVVAACALVQFHVTRDVVRSAPLRAALAASLVLAPVMVIEQLNTLTNVFWPLAVVCFWVLLVPPRSRVDTAAGATVAFLAMASLPAVFVFAPLALVTWVRGRNRRSATVLAAVVAGIVVQLMGVAGAPGTELSFGGRELESLVRGFGVRVVGATWLGEPWLKSTWLELGMPLIVGVVLATGLAIVVLVVRCDACGRRTALTALAFSGGFALATAVGRGAVIHSPGSGQWSVVGVRYVVVPLLLFLGCLVVLVDHARLDVRFGRLLRGAVVGWLVVLAAVGFRATNFRSDGPEWPDTVRELRRECTARDAPVEVPVAITPRGFEFDLPCAELR